MATATKGAWTVKKADGGAWSVGGRRTFATLAAAKADAARVWQEQGVVVSVEEVSLKWAIFRDHVRVEGGFASRAAALASLRLLKQDSRW